VGETCRTDGMVPVVVCARRKNWMELVACSTPGSRVGILSRNFDLVIN
jgi:hypothetical protein